MVHSCQLIKMKNGEFFNLVNYLPAAVGTESGEQDGKRKYPAYRNKPLF